MGRDITGNCVPRKRRVLHLRPLQHLEVATSRCRRAGRLAPRARRISFVGPLEQLKVTSAGRGIRAHCNTSGWPPRAASEQVLSSHGQGGSCPRAHCSISRCPRLAASKQVTKFQGHPSAPISAFRAGCHEPRQRKCPRSTDKEDPAPAPTAAHRGGRLRAASEQVHSSFNRQEGFCSRTHCSTSRCPPLAAAAQVFRSHGQGGSWSLACCSNPMWPPAAAAAQINSFQRHPCSSAQRGRATDVTKSNTLSRQPPPPPPPSPWTSSRVRRSIDERTALSAAMSFGNTWWRRISSGRQLYSDADALDTMARKNLFLALGLGFRV
jgi:hypothetical protein